MRDGALTTPWLVKFVTTQRLAEMGCRRVRSWRVPVAADTARIAHCICAGGQQYRRKAANLAPPWRAMLEAVRQLQLGC